MANIKERVIAAIDALPDTATYEDIMKVFYKQEKISEFIHRVNAIRSREYHNSADRIIELSSGFPVILNSSPLPSNFAQFEKEIEISAEYKKYGYLRAFILRPQILSRVSLHNYQIGIFMEILDESWVEQLIQKVKLENQRMEKIIKMRYKVGHYTYPIISPDKITQTFYVFNMDNIPPNTEIHFAVGIFDEKKNWKELEDLAKIQDIVVNDLGQIDIADKENFHHLYLNCPVCGYRCPQPWDECPECEFKLL